MMIMVEKLIKVPTPPAPPLDGRGSGAGGLRIFSDPHPPRPGLIIFHKIISGRLMIIFHKIISGRLMIIFHKIISARPSSTNRKAPAEAGADRHPSRPA